MNLNFSGVEGALLTLVAIGVAIAILVALAGSPFYPIAYAIVIVALIYIVAKDSAVIDQVNSFLNKRLAP